jgi:two-component system chemotaxis response regulator CheB
MASKYILIGGSAGSFQSIVNILNNLPHNYKHPVFLCLHRLKHVRGGFVEALSIKSKLKVIEPDDKTVIMSGKVYLAPANYHMYLEVSNSIALSTEETINHSRPSIDLTFRSAAYAFGPKVIGVLLSGANRDGAEGLKEIKDYGGTVIVQDPNEASVSVMPQSALSLVKPDYVMTINEIIAYLNSINY